MAPEKHVTLAYAATASLAAVTLVYVFGPTWFIDSSPGSSKDRKKGVVGLANPANDCFINSILQALAGLEDLRTYLSQRTQAARQMAELIGDDGLTIDQKPFLTAALKDILDNLNERPLYRKTISNRPFLIVLERVFRQRISRQQQDAHEFLQVVAETLAEEHRDQRKQEQERRSRATRKESIEDVLGDFSSAEVVVVSPPDKEPSPDGGGRGGCGGDGDEKSAAQFEGMPLEGRLRSEIECQTCKFTPKPTLSTFVVLTLPVPQKSTASLTECIEGTLSTEHIDDFQCAKCRLRYVIATLSRKLEATTAASVRAELQSTIARLDGALASDPETIPDGIDLSLFKNTPKSRIAKRTMVEDYPDIIALHLSRSIYDTYASRKNGAKVSFSETLQMGGLLDRRKYRLLCVVTHKGGHDSGHYECFRRQIVARPPFSTPAPSPTRTPAPSDPVTPVMSPTPPTRYAAGLAEDPAQRLSGELLVPVAPTPSADVGSAAPSVVSVDAGRDTPRTSMSMPSGDERWLKSPAKKIRKKRPNNKWWRISDDKIKEARTSDVLGMQKEVYLLFYQQERGEE